MQGVPAVRSTRRGYVTPSCMSDGPIVLGRANRDTQVVTSGVQPAGMNILLDCAWCQDEVEFSIDESDDELVCSACNTRMAIAPDPTTTFALLYEPVAVAA
jgi:DNA-directed RNA polymerase subunit RPC12/RpoP